MMKKIIALALALVLVMSLAVAAFAIYMPGNDGPARVARRGSDNPIILNGPEEEENPTTGAPVFAAPVAIAVIAGAAYVIGKHK